MARGRRGARAREALAADKCGLDGTRPGQRTQIPDEHIAARSYRKSSWFQVRRRARRSVLFVWSRRQIDLLWLFVGQCATIEQRLPPGAHHARSLSAATWSRGARPAGKSSTRARVPSLEKATSMLGSHPPTRTLNGCVMVSTLMGWLNLYDTSTPIVPGVTLLVTGVKTSACRSNGRRHDLLTRQAVRCPQGSALRV